MKRRFVTLDVFTGSLFGGNPLAVVLDAEGLTADQMQAVAREFNYSETTFLLPPENPDNTAVLRIFTPAREVPFAGHPNVGSAIAAARLGTLFGKPVGDSIRFEEKAGLVAVTLTRPETSPMQAELTAPEPFSLGGEVAPEIAAQCAGLAPEQILTGRHPPCVASVGLPFTLAEVSGLDALKAARPGPLDAFHALPPEAHDLMVYTRTGEGRAAARMFGPLDGVPEDPATGSACAALMGLTAHLDPRTDGTVTLDIVQGVEMGRPSRINASADKAGGTVAQVRVGGAAVPVLDGTLSLEAATDAADHSQ